MSKPQQRRRSSKHSSSTSRSNDAAVYSAFILVGVFIVFLAWLLDFAISWREVTLGYCAALAVLINMYAFQACRGTRLAGWQQALARLPLRFVGYGRTSAKPLEAAHGSDRAKMAVFVSIAVCVVILLALSVLLIPGFPAPAA